MIPKLYDIIARRKEINTYFPFESNIDKTHVFNYLLPKLSKILGTIYEFDPSISTFYLKFCGDGTIIGDY